MPGHTPQIAPGRATECAPCGVSLNQNELGEPVKLLDEEDADVVPF